MAMWSFNGLLFFKMLLIHCMGKPIPIDMQTFTNPKHLASPFEKVLCTIKIQ